MQKNNFPWDHYSDQPCVIKDKKYKKSMYKKAFFDFVKTFVTSIVLTPFIAIRYLFLKDQSPNTKTIFGMGVNVDKLPIQSIEFVQELGVKELLIRFPLSDMQNFDKYLEFVKNFHGCNITLNILQDRQHIQNLQLTSKDVGRILKEFSPYIKSVQIANAINRKKWGFASMHEYMKFYQAIIKYKKEYPNLLFIGSSTIDFEYHYTIRTLFNGFFPRYDKVASLLYVDRRGAPENTQMGFDLVKKIKLLYAIVSLSGSKSRLIISEFNWPISNTAPYAPTSEKECVDETTYTNYMVRSYLLAISTGMVETIFWHQLIASGYGLIDIRKGIRKREAYDAFKFMVQLLDGSKLLEYKFDTIYYMKFKKNKKTYAIYWAKESTDQKIKGKLFDIVGNKLHEYYINERVVYKELEC